MKRAVVRQRRRDDSGRELLNVVCPRCDGRHWIPTAATGRCPRKTTAAAFAIANTPKRAAR